MIEIEGFYWFVGAILICGTHVLYLRSWRRELRAHQAWWQQYDVNSRQRHAEIMRMLGRDDNFNDNHEKGQA